MRNQTCGQADSSKQHHDKGFSMSHKYRVTLEHVADNQGKPVTGQQVVFETENHDDILALMQRIRDKMPLDEASSQAFCLGLKLFGEVMLQHRDYPLFAEFAPHFGSFMKSLKKAGPNESPRGDHA